MTLDVKASLPLRTGEVFQLRIEKAGANVRLVQPLGKAGHGAGDAAKAATPPQGEAGVQNQAHANKAPVQAHPAPQGNSNLDRAAVARVAGTPGQAVANGVKAPGDGAARGAAAPVQAPLSGVAGTPRAIAATQILPASLQPAGAISAGQLASLGATPPPVPGGNARPETLYPGALPKGVAGAPAAAITSTTGLQGGITTTALIRAVVEALPAVDKRSDGRGPLFKPDGTAINRGAEGRGVVGRGVVSGQARALAGGLPAPSAEQVQASYQQFAGGAVEEIAELQGRAGQKPPDASFELPLGEGGRAIAVQLYVSRDGGGAEDGDERRRVGVFDGDG